MHPHLTARIAHRSLEEYYRYQDDTVHERQHPIIQGILLFLFWSLCAASLFVFVIRCYRKKVYDDCADIASGDCAARTGGDDSGKITKPWTPGEAEQEYISMEEQNTNNIPTTAAVV